ncbi:MAG: RHS repeat-associated core domain-containing protein [Chloroflexi bacterium]|nr:RHS repeat-associated core domain-containing protein [Chloroflexota bacterium]
MGLDGNRPASFLLTDHLGSTTATVFAGTGGLQSLRQYTAWGEEYSSYEVTPSGYRYTSQRWDSGLGLYDYNARYYDPTLGKFISADTLVPDPVNPQSLNRYTYVLNRPLGFTDPTGHRECGASDDCSDPLPHNLPPLRMPVYLEWWERKLLAITAFVEMHGHGERQANAINWVALNRMAIGETIAGVRLYPNPNFRATSLLAGYVLRNGQFEISETLVKGIWIVANR